MKTLKMIGIKLFWIVMLLTNVVTWPIQLGVLIYFIWQERKDPNGMEIVTYALKQGFKGIWTYLFREWDPEKFF